MFRQAKVDLRRLITLAEHDVEDQLATNLAEQDAIREALDQYCEQIERICVQLESSREFFILFDELRFDASISNAKHDFLNRLYLFTPDED